MNLLHLLDILNASRATEEYLFFLRHNASILSYSFCNCKYFSNYFCNLIFIPDFSVLLAVPAFLAVPAVLQGKFFPSCLKLHPREDPGGALMFA